MSRLLKMLNFVPKREFSLSQCLEGKRNFRKFMLFNKRGSRIFKQRQAKNPDPEIPIIQRGVKKIGYNIDGQFVKIPEMIPELIVPNLTDCELKPYVSYRAPDVIQSEFTAEELFNSVYAEKIVRDFKANMLDEDGSPLEPSPEERLTREEAFLNSRRTGADLFTQDLPDRR